MKPRPVIRPWRNRNWWLAFTTTASLAQFAGCSIDGIQNALVGGAIQAVSIDAFAIVQGILLDVFRV
ncbi:MAG: hypothetical protein HOP29_09180 [Phycisphaerales bacterium]|nr:hypothetical protein [Phycisphaerales bacterium]